MNRTHQTLAHSTPRLGTLRVRVQRGGQLSRLGSPVTSSVDPAPAGGSSWRYCATLLVVLSCGCAADLSDSRSEPSVSEPQANPTPLFELERDYSVRSDGDELGLPTPGLVQVTPSPLDDEAPAPTEDPILGESDEIPAPVLAIAVPSGEAVYLAWRPGSPEGEWEYDVSVTPSATGPDRRAPRRMTVVGAFDATVHDLLPGQRYTTTVRATDNEGNRSGSSEALSFVAPQRPSELLDGAVLHDLRGNYDRLRFNGGAVELDVDALAEPLLTGDFLALPLAPETTASSPLRQVTSVDLLDDGHVSIRTAPADPSLVYADGLVETAVFGDIGQWSPENDGAWSLGDDGYEHRYHVAANGMVLVHDWRWPGDSQDKARFTFDRRWPFERDLGSGFTLDGATAVSANLNISAGVLSPRIEASARARLDSELTFRFTATDGRIREWRSDEIAGRSFTFWVWFVPVRGSISLFATASFDPSLSMNGVVSMEMSAETSAEFGYRSGELYGSRASPSVEFDITEFDLPDLEFVATAGLVLRTSASVLGLAEAHIDVHPYVAADVALRIDSPCALEFGIFDFDRFDISAALEIDGGAEVLGRTLVERRLFESDPVRIFGLSQLSLQLQAEACVGRPIDFRFVNVGPNFIETALVRPEFRSRSEFGGPYYWDDLPLGTTPVFFAWNDPILGALGPMCSSVQLEVQRCVAD